MRNPLELLAELVAAFDSILARVWLVGPEDEDDPTSRPCLHLKASAGLTDRVEGPFRRLPIEGQPMDQVIVRGQPFVANEPLENRGLAESDWIRRHGARTFAAFPLPGRGPFGEAGPRGALAIFSRRILTIDDDRCLAAIARLLSIALEERPRRLRDVERGAIEFALGLTHGRVSGPLGAARILGLKPTTLHSRMRKLGIRRVSPERATIW